VPIEYQSMDRICGSAWGPFLASNEVPTGAELVAGGGVICATVPEVTVLKAEYACLIYLQWN